MKQESLEDKLQTNTIKQENIKQKLLLMPKGHINTLYRNNKGYYYLTYRNGNKINNDYLGPVGKTDLQDILSKLNERDKLNKELKQLKIEEKEIKAKLHENTQK